MAFDPIANAKKYFFDRKLVLDRVNAKRVRAMSRLGAYIMTAARRSMKTAPPERPAGAKRRKNARPQYSRPGSPPYKRIGFLVKFLFFVYDPSTNSVVIGPTGLRKSKVPALMEYGGVARVRGNVVRYEPRPYMGPAYQREISRFPQELKDLL